MEQLVRDIRYGIRSLLKARGFAAVAVITIALGIGVNSTIFSLVNAVLFRPLPVDAPSELVDIYGRTATSSDHGTSSFRDFEDFRAETETLSGMLAFTNFFANLSIQGSSELVIGELVSRDYFRVLGVQPSIGRAFTEEEFAAPGAGPVAILSRPFWESRFGADPDVAGRTFRLNGTPYTVIGVAPEGFGGMFPAVTAQMWVPVTMVDGVEPMGNQRGFATSESSILDQRGRRFLWVKGRRAEGASIAQVQAEIEGIAARLSSEYPDTNERERVAVLATNDVALNPDFDATIAPAGMVLLGAVGLVLLVACANLANMTLARASSRGRELALRHTLGAGQGRLVRQLLTESMMLALTGGAVAMAIAYGLSRLIARFQPPLPIELAVDVSPDWRVLVFTLVVACVTGIAFGLIPALRASRPDLVPALKGSSEGDGPRRAFSVRNALVVVQVAVSIVVLVAGALLVRSIAAAGKVDMGYDVDRIGYMAFVLEMNGYDREDGRTLMEEGARRLLALPQVEAVGLTSRFPLDLNNNGFGIYLDGHQTSADSRPYIMDGASVDEHYFEALELALLEGRGITEADRDNRERVAVITKTMADRYWPEGALQEEFRTSWDGEPWRVVGVVQDYKVDTPGEAPKAYLHIPLRRDPGSIGYLIRSSTPAAGNVGAYEATLREIDPELVFLSTGTTRELADVRLFPIRAGAWLIGIFGVLALVIASVGLYGVVNYSVSRRVREIGIRKALGAETGVVIGMVLREGMTMVGIGVAAGVVLAALAARALSSVLFVGALDLTSFLVACGVLALVAAAANLVPARRASRVDPLVAFKAE